MTEAHSTDEASEFALLGCLFEEPSNLDKPTFSCALFTGARKELAKALLQLRIKGQSITPENVKLITKSDDLELLAKKANTRILKGSFDLLVERLKDVRIRAAIATVCKDGYNAAYDESKEGKDVLEDLETRILGIRSKAATKGLSYGSDIQDERALIDWRNENPNAFKGLSTGLAQLDRAIDGLGPLLYYLGARPSCGKTSLALQVMMNIAMTGARVLFFSAETSATLLKQRAISYFSGVQIGRIGRCHSPKERQMIDKAMAIMATLDWIIDDTSGPTVTHCQSVIRQLHREKPISMIVGDYYQLFRGYAGKNYKSRYEELCDVSTGWKGVTKDFNVPVLLLAQLSRPAQGVYDRELKQTVTPEPQIHDLKECLAVGTTLLWTNDGVRRNVASFMNTLSLTSSDKITPVPSFDIPRGIRRTIRVSLKSGREIQCTPDHLILTDRGYVKAGQLTRDHSIACAWRLEAPKGAKRFDWAKWAGQMIGNGCYLEYATPSFICSCAKVAADFVRFVESYFSIKVRTIKDGPGVWEYSLPGRDANGRNAVKQFLLTQGFSLAHGPLKAIPVTFLGQADDDSIAEMLAGLFETDGSFYNSGGPKVTYSTTSEILSQQILWCLSRLGIFAKVGTIGPSKHRNKPLYKIVIAESMEIGKFQRLIKVKGRKGDVLRSFETTDKPSHASSRLGKWIQEWIKSEKDDLGISWRELGYRCQGKHISAHDFTWVCAMLKTHGSKKVKEMEWLCNPSIYWDSLKFIEPAGIVAVFDREVPGPNNFVANGIICHNCGQAEQDADGVWLLDRNQSQNAPEAKLIIGKNKDGPLDKIRLTFTPETYTFRQA